MVMSSSTKGATMTTCATNHPPIAHDEFYCPLCVALDEVGAAQDELIALEKTVEDVGLDTIVSTRLDVEREAARAYRAENKAYRLENAICYAIRSTGTIAKRMQTLSQALATTREEAA